MQKIKYDRKSGPRASEYIGDITVLQNRVNLITSFENLGLGLGQMRSACLWDGLA